MVLSPWAQGLRTHAMKTCRNRPWLPVVLAGLVLLAAEVRGGIAQEAPALTPAANDSPETHVGRGYEALKQDRYEAAVSEFRAALELDPKLVLRARFPLAVALFELHQFDQARREFETVRLEVGDHSNILYYLGRLDLESRNFAGAITGLSKAVEKPPFPDTAYYLGFAYFKQGDLPAAEKWLEEAARLNARDARIPYQLGFVYRKQGREQDASKAFALSDELHLREDTEGKLRLECAQKLEQGLREEAHAVCEKLYDPDNAEKLMTLGTIYGQHGDLEAALKPLRRAAELAPQSPQMQYNLSLAYFQLNRFREARAPLAHAIQRWPDLFQLNRLYGAILLRLGESLSAYQALRHAHQLNPEDSGTTDLLYEAALGLADKDQAAGRYPESLRHLEEASKLRPRSPEPHRRMAKVYALSARPARATREQQAADRLSKGSAE
jgi:tetratricopeptide (TPR) repeat protein